MKNKQKIFIMIMISSMLPLVGYGSWLLVANENFEYEYIKLPHPVVAVAYIKYSESNKQYTTTIERALELAAEDPAANKIYVVPGTNPTITRNTLIALGDTLIIPYEAELTGETFDKNLANGIADKDGPSVTTNRKNSITVADGITLTVNGKIIIGGQAGKGGTGNTGFTSKFYTEIVMGNSAIINNHGVIDNFGYIKEYNKDNGSQINVTSTGKISMPLVFYDYRGGTFSLEAVNSRHYVFPFTIFDLPNIQSRIIYTVGAILEGKVVIPATGLTSANRRTANIIGGEDSIALFRIKSGSMSFKYTPNRAYTYANNFTTNDALRATNSEGALNLTHVDVTGNVNFSSLKINVGTEIDSANFFLPLSYKFQIKVKDGGTVNVQNKMKFYKGALIEIESGGTANLNNQTMFYQKYFEQTTTGGTFYPSYFNSPPGHTARLVNNGTLLIDAPFAGKVDTSIPGAIITIGNGFSPDVTTKEMVAVPPPPPSKEKYSFTEITGYAIGDISSDMEEIMTETQFSQNEGTQYTSQGLWWLGPPGSATPIDEDIGDVQEDSPPSSCIAFNTLVTMEDGSTKQAGLLRAGDMIKVFNHETGTIDVAPVLFNDDIDKMAEEYTVVYLQFNNGKQIKIVDEHGFFDINTMKYEYINEFNYVDYIGHAFVMINGDCIEEARLNHAFIKKETIKICSPTSYYHLNLIIEGFLSMPGGISGLFNIFEYDQNLQYNEAKKTRDIEQFGLFTYDDFKEMIPLEFYQAFPTPYLKVSIGKGLLTMARIELLIERYLPVATEQQE